MKISKLYCVVIPLVLLNLGSCKRSSVGNNYPAGSMEYPERAVTQRASSYDRDWKNGNKDARNLDPGQTLILGDLKGPGRINHIWFTAAGNERGFTRSAVIRIYWDGSDKPAVEVPLGDFFAAGHGMQVDVNSSRVSTTSYGRAYNSYWAMPFRKSARITMTNESPTESMGLYWSIEWEKREVPADVPYFYAQYRQENPVKPGSDYVIADIRGKGHYAGTVLSVRASHPGWFGEGDDRFYVDGDSIPTLHGTGTEDYFNDAWAFRVVNRPNYGVSIWEGMNAGSHITAYRWHVTDPVFFEDSLRFAIEHKGNLFFENYSLADGYTDRRPDFFSSVAFWYQLGEPKMFPRFPPVSERMPPFKLIQVDEIPAGKLPHNIQVQEDNSYTNKKGLQFTPHHEGESVLLPFEIAESGNYLVYIRVWPRGDAGIYDFLLDDQKMINASDLFSEHHFVTDIELGHMLTLRKGNHTIRAVYRGTSNPGSPGCLFVDAIVLEPMGNLEKLNKGDRKN
jgi:hypothetical protein